MSNNLVGLSCTYMKNKSSGKKILNTTFYLDQNGINRFNSGKSALKGNKQVKTKISNYLANAKNMVGCDD